jgi:hypothetical protein
MSFPRKANVRTRNRHKGSALSAACLAHAGHRAVRSAEVVERGNKSVETGQFAPILRAGQIVVDLVNFKLTGRPGRPASCYGLCW